MGSESSSFQESDKADSDMLLESESIGSDKEEQIELVKNFENQKIKEQIS